MRDGRTVAWTPLALVGSSCRSLSLGRTFTPQTREGFGAAAEAQRSMLRTHGTMPAFVSRSISSGLLAHSSAYLHATTHVHGCGGLVDVIVLVVGSYDLFKQCARARSMRTGSTRPGERVTKRAGRWARGWRRRRWRWRWRWRWCFSLALCDAKRAASEDSRPHEAIVGTIDHRLLVPHRRTYITQKTASLEPTAKRAISHRRIH